MYEGESLPGLDDTIESDIDSEEKNEKEEIVTTQEIGFKLAKVGKTVAGGADVKTLYPNIKANNTGKVVKEVTMKSDVNFEGMNYKKSR